MTEWTTLDTMRTAVATVMTVPRITLLAREPLKHREVLEVLEDMEPPPAQKERNKWEKFYSKLPLVKARQKLVEEWAKAAKAVSDKKKKGK